MAQRSFLPFQTPSTAAFTDLFSKAKNFFQDVKAKISGEEYITFDAATEILKRELHYPEDRALYFVKRFDHNNDGRLSVAEFTQFRRKLEETKEQIVPKFKEYDIDGNGYISLDEATTILESPPFKFPSDKVALLLRRFDKDGNGKLDIEEFAGFYAEAKATHEDIALCFDQLDRDGNGVLSPDEVMSIIREKMGYDETMARNLIGMFDQNRDGNLDKTEFMQMWASMFGQ